MKVNYIQVITTTAGRKDAQRIAGAVVERRLAACAQIIGPIKSTYWWKGKIETAEEWLCVMKTQRCLYGRLEDTIRRLHPYEVPEIIALPILSGSKTYLAWLNQELIDKKRNK